MDNIKNMIKRIGSEAETTEDMEKLLLSELKAYRTFRNNHPGAITLYDHTEILENYGVMGNYAVIGTLEESFIVLQQKMDNGVLDSKYIEYKIL